MLQFNKILPPTDFRNPSYEALEVARDSAKRFSAEPILAHVITPVPMLPYSPTVPNFISPLHIEELEASANKYVQQVAVERVGGDVSTRAIVAEGSPADKLLDLAEKNASI